VNGRIGDIDIPHTGLQEPAIDFREGVAGSVARGIFVECLEDAFLRIALATGGDEEAEEASRRVLRCWFHS